MKISELKNIDDLAALLKVDINNLQRLVYRIKNEDFVYTHFEIPKKSGDTRGIDAPCKALLRVQQALGTALSSYQEEIWAGTKKPKAVHGFVKGRNIYTNAEIHANKDIVLNFDLDDFFPSISFNRVYRFFLKNKYFKLPKQVAYYIATLCCYNNHLPQGAATSPVVSNLIASSLDRNLIQLAREYRCHYTRYADDLTFSTSNKVMYTQWVNFVEKVEKIVNKCGFKLNHSKTRFQIKNTKHSVTGLCVNKDVNVDNYYYKQTRAMAYSYYKTGQYAIDGKVYTNPNKLEGRLSFIAQIEDCKNPPLEFDIKNYKYNRRELEYQKFLFYKLFVNNSHPMIITEGKTDVIYIKSAMMNYSEEYPELIEISGQKFHNRIKFLKRDARIRKYLRISEDGASDLEKLLFFYHGNSQFPNYYKFFSDIGCKFKNPVILLFDNETYADSKLNCFINHVIQKKLRNEVRTKIQSQFFVRISPKWNVYLMVIPKDEDDDESFEIESLFEIGEREKILSEEVNRDGSCELTSDNKSSFADYVFEHRSEINFSRFKRLLDVIKEIISDYHGDIVNEE